MKKYNFEERTAIEIELINYFNCKNKSYDEKLSETWINKFSEMDLEVQEIIKRIRLAKLIGTKGSLDFQTFLNLNIEDYNKYYTHEIIN